MIQRTISDYPAVEAEALASGASAASGVSWGAIFAGAAAAAALSFILVFLGFGFGFSAVSPWSGEGLSAQTIGYSTIAWLTFTQIAASAIGGYMAGRLRVKWAGLHTHEVYFRDTAHGFLAWAVASLATAALLTSAIGSAISGGAKVVGAAGGAVATVSTAGAAAAASGAGANPDAAASAADSVSGYFIDSLFRVPNAAQDPMAATPVPVTPPPGSDVAAPAAPAPVAPLADGRDSRGRDAVPPAQRAEVARIFANALRTGSLPDADRIYTAQVLAKRTGMSQSDAEKRVNATFTAYKRSLDDAAAKAKQAADTARKAAAYGSAWIFVALLCGAFVASLFATYGGRQRDRVEWTTATRTRVEPETSTIA